jgi:hypothetical protein
MRKMIDWVGSGPRFEDSAAEPWYDELITAWRPDAARVAEQVKRLDLPA